MADSIIKPRYMVLAGVLTFVAGVIVQAPAALIYGWLAPKAGLPVQLRGVGGTLTQGKSEQLRYDGKIAATDVEWTLQPLGLLLAQLRYQLHSAKPPLIIDGVVSSGLGGVALTVWLAGWLLERKRRRARRGGRDVIDPILKH